MISYIFFKEDLRTSAAVQGDRYFFFNYRHLITLIIRIKVN